MIFRERQSFRVGVDQYDEAVVAGEIDVVRFPLDPRRRPNWHRCPGNALLQLDRTP